MAVEPIFREKRHSDDIQEAFVRDVLKACCVNPPKVSIGLRTWNSLSRKRRLKVFTADNPTLSQIEFSFVNELYKNVAQTEDLSGLRKYMIRTCLRRVCGGRVENLDPQDESAISRLAHLVQWKSFRCHCETEILSDTIVKEIFRETLQHSASEIGLAREEASADFLSFFKNFGGALFNQVRASGGSCWRTDNVDPNRKIGVVQLKEGSPVVFHRNVPMTVKRAAVQASLYAARLLLENGDRLRLAQPTCSFLLLFGQRNAVNVVYECFAGRSTYLNGSITSIALDHENVLKTCVDGAVGLTKENRDFFTKFYGFLNWVAPFVISDVHGKQRARRIVKLLSEAPPHSVCRFGGGTAGRRLEPSALDAQARSAASHIRRFTSELLRTKGVEEQKRSRTDMCAEITLFTMRK